MTARPSPRGRTKSWARYWKSYGPSERPWKGADMATHAKHTKAAKPARGGGGHMPRGMPRGHAKTMPMKGKMAKMQGGGRVMGSYSGSDPAILAARAQYEAAVRGGGRRPPPSAPPTRGGGFVRGRGPVYGAKKGSAVKAKETRA